MSNIDLAEELNKLIKKYRGDNNQKIVKGGVSAIPFFGGVIAEFIGDPFEQRLIDFLTCLVWDMNKIKERVDNLDSLSNKKEFTTTLINTIQIATRYHQEEKLKALRTVLLNSQLENDLDFDVRFIFIRLVDEFTPTHLTLLDFIDNPREWFEKKNIKLDREMEKHRGGSARVDWDGMSVEGRKFLQNIFPDVEEKFEFYNQVLQDLMNKGLVELVIGVNISLLDLHNSVFKTTQLGVDFKKFVLTPPIELDKLHDSAGKGEF